MLVSLEGSTFGICGPKRSIPNGLVCRDRRDSAVARRDTSKTENLRRGRPPRTGKDIANWETVLVSRVYENALVENSQKLVKKTDNAITCKGR